MTFIGLRAPDQFGKVLEQLKEKGVGEDRSSTIRAAVCNYAESLGINVDGARA